ncbi:MAG: glycosyltransferase family 2 protein [Calditrichaeota bacterium]|nr:glycosyltransferase family 2 protein [Calditrichota bacterium]
MAKTRSLSIVIPAYNEEESLDELISHLERVCDSNNYTYEIIFINDGSSDGTLEKIRDHHKRNPLIKCIDFRRNFGKSAALAEGFRYAEGDLIITMDADLQDDPDEIVHLIEKIDEGFDLVSGWKKKRNDPLGKTIPSKFFNLVTSRLSGIKLHDFNCGLKAYRKVVVKSIQVYGEMHRYLPVLAYWQGFRIGEIPVTHHARQYGRSKFGARRFFSGFFDLLTVLFITKYKRKPMHIFGMLGLFFFSIGFVILSYLTTIWLMGEGIGGRPLLIFGVLAVIVGIQFIGIGLLGEMITHTSQKKRDYSIREFVGIRD